MFLHLINPDGKFLPQIRGVFEAAAPGEHEYVFVDVFDGHDELPSGAGVLRDTRSFPALVAGTDWRGILVHGVRFAAMGLLVDAVPERLPLAWYVWGYEAYSSWPPLRRGLLLPETQKVVDRLAGRSWRAALGPLRGLRPRTALRHEMLRVARRYRLFVAPFPEEYELFASTGLLAHAAFRRGTYGSLEDYVDVSRPPTGGEDWQVGNSADPSNNHLDAFSLLPGGAVDSTKIIVPLTYGDRRYSREVQTEGRQRFGERFIPLLDFLPGGEYEGRLASCGHVVMAHRRQQAVGNVLAALWRGAGVHMHDTTFFRALRRMGFHVGLIDECRDAGGRLSPVRPGDDGVARNRDLLRRHWDRALVLGETRSVLDALARSADA